MKKLLFLVIFAAIIACAPERVTAGPLLFSTEGYVSGQLSKVSRDKNITRAYVGEISLGHESVTFIDSGNQPLEQKHLVGDIHTMDREISYGVEFGRITNVIKNKGTSRSYFMTMQVGNGGSKFRHFMIDDPDIYDFAVTVLKNAAMVRVHYSDRLTTSIGFYGFYFRSMVSEIEIVD